MPPRLPIYLRRVALGLGAGVALWLLVSLLVCYLLTRRPHALMVEQMPIVPWGKLESLRLDTSDGEQLGAWFTPGNADLPVVLLLHGNHGRRGDCLPQAAFLAGAGYGVLLLSLRCHGDSTGDFNDIGYSARHDVIAAVDWLETHHPGRPRVVWGQSLGSAAATFAGKELGERVHGYILECPYQDLYTAVRHRTEKFLPPVLDRIGYAGMALMAPCILPELERIAPVRAVAEIPRRVPVLILAGGADRLARVEEATAIYDQVAEQAELIVMEGADHVGLQRAEPQRYQSLTLAFCKRISGK